MYTCLLSCHCIQGFTTYAERRIVEVVQGEERAALNMGIGWRWLNQNMERFKDNMEFTKLKPKMAGIDPDDVYSEVPYEKGFQFLWRIERQVGGTSYFSLQCNTVYSIHWNVCD
jgi:leukotriene-A4 hydrolase